jgi:hypothetical protein
MNVKTKRRRAVSKAPRQEGTAEAAAPQERQAAESKETAARFAAGRLTLKEALPESRFVRLEVPCGDYHPCNPSIAKDGEGGLAFVVRTVNYELGDEDGIWFRDEGKPNTVNYLGTLDQNLSQTGIARIDDEEIRKTRPPAAHGLEDARLFWWEGDWWFICTALHHGAKIRGTMSMGRLRDNRVGHFEFLHSPHGHDVEKNWAVRVDGKQLAVVYNHHPAESYELAPARRRLHIGHFQGLDKWSGGSQLIRHGEGWVSVVHQRRKDRNRVYYTHRLVRYDDNLAPTHAGREFYFRGNQVEFCAGLVQHGDDFVLSFGVKDREAWLVRLVREEFDALLAAE